MIVLSRELSLLTTRNSMSPLCSSSTAFAGRKLRQLVVPMAIKEEVFVDVHSLKRAFGFFCSSGDSEDFIRLGEGWVV